MQVCLKLIKLAGKADHKAKDVLLKHYNTILYSQNCELDTATKQCIRNHLNYMLTLNFLSQSD